MRTLADDDDEVTSGTGASKRGVTQQPAWMRTLLQNCKTWAEALPGVSLLDASLPERRSYTMLQALSNLRANDIHDPLYRFFSRETSIGKKLLSQVRRDLADVIKVCEGSLKQTNHLRTLMSALTKGGLAQAPQRLGLVLIGI